MELNAFGVNPSVAPSECNSPHFMAVVYVVIRVPAMQAPELIFNASISNECLTRLPKSWRRSARHDWLAPAPLAAFHGSCVRRHSGACDAGAGAYFQRVHFQRMFDAAANNMATIGQA